MEGCFCRLWKTRQVNVDGRLWLFASSEATVHRPHSIDGWQHANTTLSTVPRHVFHRPVPVLNRLPETSLRSISDSL
jgi:hypothetical protein